MNDYAGPSVRDAGKPPLGAEARLAPSTSWPVWATEPVEIVDYDPTWPERAVELQRQVGSVLGGLLDSEVAHVGSTAVPGLAAKPIIDLMASVRSLESAAEIACRRLGDRWHLVPPELDERTWRRFFVLVEDGSRAAHLHLIASGHRRFEEQLQFRDALRRDAGLAMAYAELKRRLGERHANDREAYSVAKTSFVQEVLER